MSTPKLFSERIKKLRADMGLGQSAFAKLLHVSRNYVSMLEGGREPSAVLHAHFERLERDFALLSIHERVDAAARLAALHGGTHDQQDAAFNRAMESPAQALVGEKGHAYVTGARAKLQEARLAKGMTPAQLAKAIGYSQVSMYLDIEEGRSQMGEKMARKAAKILGIDVSELMDGSDHPVERGAAQGTFGALPDIQLPPGMKAKYVPLLAMAQCGTSMAWDDGGYTGEGFLAFNPQDPKAFAVTLSGDSMIPRIEPGDVALIYPSKPPKNGCVVIARLNEDNGGDVMVKLYQANGERVTLSSYNPAYPPMQYSRADFAWIYPVAKITKDM